MTDQQTTTLDQTNPPDNERVLLWANPFNENAPAEWQWLIAWRDKGQWITIDEQCGGTAGVDVGNPALWTPLPPKPLGASA